MARVRSDGISYDLPAVRAGAVILITNPAVKFIRVQGDTPDAGILFEHVTLTGYVHAGRTDAVVGRIRAAMDRPLYATAQPVTGLAWPGTLVQGPAGAWKVTSRADITLTSAAAADATSLTVASTGGITDGDVIGVLRTDGATHWTSVASVSGSTLTLNSGIPVGAANGAAVGTTRWSAASVAP